MIDNIDLIIITIFLAITYATGNSIEKKHFRQLLERESKTKNIPVSSNDEPFEQSEHVQIELLVGSCVIGSDYFKRTLAALKGIFGGKIGAYESLLDRARREAILRMKESAKENCVEIACFRITTTNVQPGMLEAVAYGTAIYKKA